MEYFNGPHLFNSMFADDVEASKLAHLPAVATLLESYPYFAFYFFIHDWRGENRYFLQSQIRNLKGSIKKIQQHLIKTNK